jgi:hypothetical protein
LRGAGRLHLQGLQLDVPGESPAAAHRFPVLHPMVSPSRPCSSAYQSGANDSKKPVFRNQRWTAGSVTTTALVPHRRSLLPSVRVVLDFLSVQLGTP